MSKHKSRSQRCADIIGDISCTIDELESLKSDLESLPDIEGFDDMSEEEYENARRDSAGDIITSITDTLSNIDSGAIEELRDEIDSWATGMEGTNLENTEKYHTLCDTAELLDSARCYIDQIDTEITPDMTIEDVIEHIDSVVSDIESAMSELESCEFPGMYR